MENLQQFNRTPLWITQMYPSEQKSPTAFSSASLLEFKMQPTLFAQQWLFPLEISKQVTQNILPLSGHWWAWTCLHSYPWDSATLSITQDPVSAPLGPTVPGQRCRSRAGLQFPTATWVLPSHFCAHSPLCLSPSPRRCPMLGPGPAAGVPPAGLLLVGMVEWAPQL